MLNGARTLQSTQGTSKVSQRTSTGRATCDSLIFKMTIKLEKTVSINAQTETDAGYLGKESGMSQDCQHYCWDHLCRLSILGPVFTVVLYPLKLLFYQPPYQYTSLNRWFLNFLSVFLNMHKRCVFLLQSSNNLRMF